jgi:MerR family transcriptional regulator, mercuric resistance operon regulatory protein
MPALAPATIAELARRSGIDVASIRLYEEIGLLPRPRRRRGRRGDAAYHQEHFDRLAFIKRARDLGLPLETIAELVGVNGGLRTCNDIYQIVQRHLAGLRQGPGQPTPMETTLKNLADACPRKGSRSDCVILAALSRSSEC